MSETTSPAALRATTRLNDALILGDLAKTPWLVNEEAEVAAIIEQETAVGALVQALTIQLAENGHTHHCNLLQQQNGGVDCSGKCFVLREALAKNRLGSEWTEADPCAK